MKSYNLFVITVLPPSTYQLCIWTFLVVFLTGKLGNLFTLPCSEILHLDLQFLKVAQRAVAHPTTCHWLNSSFREVAPAAPAKQTENIILLNF